VPGNDSGYPDRAGRKFWDGLQKIGTLKKALNLFPQVLEHFEVNLQQLIDCFLDKVRSLFIHGRYIDVRYFKSLSLIGEAMESAAFEQESSPEKELSEKTSNILSRIALCHDAHQEHLLEEEVALQVNISGLL
jgi:hypothetical protein